MVAVGGCAIFWPLFLDFLSYSSCSVLIECVMGGKLSGPTNSSPFWGVGEGLQGGIYNPLS